MKTPDILIYCLCLFFGGLPSYADNRENIRDSDPEIEEPEIAVNETDSIDNEHQLDEIVVESGVVNTTTRMTSYLPTKKQRNASQNASDLLNRMAIPQLQFTGLDGTIKTVGGQSVSVFIDYVPATAEDQQAMRMTDVKRVEYYDFPDDPRFQGKSHVINFIMQQYEYGGYAKATMSEYFIANSTRGSLFGRVQYKKMTYDLYLGGYHPNTRHVGNNAYETYRIPMSDGDVKEFERNTLTDKSRYEITSLYPSLQILYKTEKTTMRNSVYYSFSNSPFSDNSGHVEYFPEDYKDGYYNSHSSSKSNNVYYYGYWNYILPKNNSLTVRPNFIFDRSRSLSRFDEQSFGEIFTRSKTRSVTGSLNLNFDHDFKKGGRLQLLLNSNVNSSRIRYSGSSDADNLFTTWQFSPYLNYSISRDKIYAGISLGYDMVWSEFGGKTEFKGTPAADLNVQLTLTPKHSLSLWGSYSLNAIPQSLKNPAMIQVHPLLYMMGNPDLKPYKQYYLSFNYNWNVAPWLSLSPNLWMFGAKDVLYLEYLPIEGRNAILQTYGQRGSKPSYNIMSTLSVSSRLFNNRLVLWGRIGYDRCVHALPVRRTLGVVEGLIMATYYAGSFNFGLIYETRTKNAMDLSTFTINRSPYDLTFTAGWGNSDWNVSANISNPQRWNWKGSESINNTPYYILRRINFSTSYHCYVYLSATYTIGFGRKISHDNEATGR